jgi:hypothetical protein
MRRSPLERSLTFGRGEVDDAEDAEIICTSWGMRFRTRFVRTSANPRAIIDGDRNRYHGRHATQLLRIVSRQRIGLVA